MSLERLLSRYLLIANVGFLSACATTQPINNIEKSSMTEASPTEETSVPSHDDLKLTDDMVSFYLDVEKQSQSPPSEEALRKICEVKTEDDKYITFMSADDDKALLFALTDKKMGVASESVYLYTRYFEDPVALIRVSAWKKGVTPDWAYIFDRNQDGRVDYLAYLDGPRPVAPIGYEDELPKFPGSMKYDKFMFFIKNQPLTFWHVADDNHDGKADGMAMRAAEVKSGWSHGWMVVKSSTYNEKFDMCTYYSEHNISESHSCKRTFLGNKYVVSDQYEAPALAKHLLNKWLSIVNKAVHDCGFDQNTFYSTPHPFDKVETDHK